MKRGIIVASLAAATLLLAGCAGDAAVRADAARIKAMGVSLQSMSKNISDDENVRKCVVTRESSGWLTSAWSDEETFTATCEKDPYGGEGEYEGNVPASLY